MIIRCALPISHGTLLCISQAKTKFSFGKFSSDPINFFLGFLPLLVLNDVRPYNEV